MFTRVPLRPPEAGADAALGGAAKRRAWIAGAAFWTGLSVFLALEMKMLLPPDRPASLAQVLVVNLIWFLLWGVLSVPILRLAGRFPIVRGRILRAVAVHLAGFLGACAIQIALSELLLHPMRGSLIREMPFGQAMLAHARYNGPRYLLLYWALVAVADFLRVRRVAQEEALAAAGLREDLARAELSALRLQMQPHFLFNAMNTAAEYVHSDPELADAMLVHLARLLRASLESTDRPEVTLAQELENVRLYLAVERLRHGPRLSTEERIPAGLEDALVPSFLLQPLVENAIRHGVDARSQASRIEIVAEVRLGALELEVSNDVGARRRRLAPSGVGLANVRQRLERLYGHAASLTLRLPESGAGRAQVRIHLPLRRFSTARGGVAVGEVL